MNHFVLVAMTVITFFSCKLFAAENLITTYLKVDKIGDQPETQRFVFSVCEVQECEILGRSTGYDYYEIKSLSGRAQKYIGAPLLAMSEAGVGAGVAVLASAAAIPAATSATIYAVMGGGMVSAVTVPSLTLDENSNLRVLSPSYHWTKGSVKVRLEQAVKFLNRSQDESTLIVYQEADSEDVEAFYELVVLAERILTSLH